MARRVVVLAAVLALVAVPVAHADGDPASDYLLSQTVFAPPDSGVPSAYVRQLTDLLANAKARGYQTRVALIATKYDMGTVAALWRQPKPYAHFLSQELYFVYRGRVIVVMPNGLGAARGGKPAPADQQVLSTIRPQGTDGTALATAATRAVVRLAAHSGVVVATPPLRGGSGSSTTRDRIVIAAGAALLVALGAAATFFWRRLRGART